MDGWNERERQIFCQSNKQKMFCCPAGSRVRRQKIQRKDVASAIASRILRRREGEIDGEEEWK